jgi:WD40 repeat protein
MFGWSPDNRMLVTGGRDYFVRFWDVESGREVGRVNESWNVITSLKWINNDPYCVAQGALCLLSTINVSFCRFTHSYACASVCLYQ